MRSVHLVLLVALSALTGCAAATEAPNEPTAPVVAAEPAASPAPEKAPEVTPPTVPTTTQDAPGPQCASARFVSDPATSTAKDSVTGLTWIATDIAFMAPIPDAATACGVGVSGFRPATSAEVIALTSSVPGCKLPLAFAGVYAWAPGSTKSGPLPIVTSDGCVDVATGASFAGACHLVDQNVSASTLCVK